MTYNFTYKIDKETNMTNHATCSDREKGFDKEVLVTGKMLGSCTCWIDGGNSKNFS
jgi:hypothetical protein